MSRTMTKNKTRTTRSVKTLKAKRNRTRMLAQSLIARRIVQRNRGMLLNAYRLIKENFDNLKKGNSIKSKGIFVGQAATGKFKGKKNFLTLLVKAKGMNFFVKIFELRNEVDIMQGFSTLENWLQQHHYTVEGIKIKPLRPLLLYEDSNSKVGYLVTPFFREGEVEQVQYMEDKQKKKKITAVIGRLNREMEALHDVWEIATVNAFYHPRTDSVLLFDIYRFMPY